MAGWRVGQSAYNKQIIMIALVLHLTKTESFSECWLRARYNARERLLATEMPDFLIVSRPAAFKARPANRPRRTE